MIIDAYSARDIDVCQCLGHTGRVSITTASPTQAGTLAASSTLTSTPTSSAPASAALPAGCCTPLLREPITPSQAADLAQVLKALAEPVRLQLVSLVASHDGGEACVCELTEPLGLTQPTISHHLKILVDAGIFSRDKRGVWAYYSLVPGALHALAAVLGPAR
jgi:ArsR family transcriptional regulator